MKLARIVLGSILAAAIVIYRPDMMLADALTPDVGVERGSHYLKEYGRKIVILTHATQTSGGGTGFAIEAPSGKTYTITNSHVCRIGLEMGKLKATWDDGRSVILDILNIDYEHDLCLLSGMPIMQGLKMADLDAKVGDPIFIIGHPQLYPNTFSEGLVRARTDLDVMMGYDEEFEGGCSKNHLKKKEMKSPFGDENICYETFDAFDTSVVGYPGNSGSPVFNFNGRVIGVIFAGGGMNTLSYVPLEHLQDLIRTF